MVSDSIKLLRSRPVLITQHTPRSCSAPIKDSSSFATGGFSKSVCKVPSKSVEINLIGGFIHLGNARRDPDVTFVAPAP
jgi:hypothetical protein